MGGRVSEAIDMCLQNKVEITDDLADKMTPDKKKAKDKQAWKDLVLKLARVCKKQGSYHLAARKYTQGGDRLKAMKCLLKSGETEKIVFFANCSRDRDICILAANYLQNLDWHNNP